MFYKQRLLLFSLLVFTPFLKATDPDVLFQPFGGFSKAGMAPVLELFQADTEGRQLLRKAVKKTNSRNLNELIETFCFCTPKHLAGNSQRRGLFMQQTMRFYRAKGDAEWRSESLGGLEKLNDPQNHPVVAQRESTTKNFEHLQVAFRPKICLAKGLNVLQAYLVLFHELTHLTGLDPFHDFDLFDFELHEMERQFYFKQLEKPGGELDAYLAQMNAFRRVRERYDLPLIASMESFLSKKGRLSYRDKPDFLNLLLYEAKYKIDLDANLDTQIYVQYNRAQSWWAFLNQYLENLDTQLVGIDAKIESARSAEQQAKKDEDPAEAKVYRDTRIRLEQQRLLNRRKYHDYEADQKEFIRFMEALDVRFPEDG